MHKKSVYTGQNKTNKQKRKKKKVILQVNYHTKTANRGTTKWKDEVAAL